MEAQLMSLARPFLLLLLFLSLSSTTVRSDPDAFSAVQSPCPTSKQPPSSQSCPIRCFRADPVCGVNGVTYWCGCPEAACNGVRVAKIGPCGVGNGGSGGQAFLLVHIVWLILLGFSVLFGLF
ncbi:hypothetical protein QJS10_CPA03g02091 [Acorus calamus]|uniref:Uncharacterized protein n=1 Tax=Acorus calamus TaxID=4465 RepID=A0AAV9F5S4_ACOCL|nr:hypothetical protein QJS10_CPA03g02091 [Acorus calamus]